MNNTIKYKKKTPSSIKIAIEQDFQERLYLHIFGILEEIHQLVIAHIKESHYVISLLYNITLNGNSELLIYYKKS